MMNTKTKTQHKRYDETFKPPPLSTGGEREAGRADIATELGINVPNLHKWKQRFKVLPAGQVANTLEAGVGISLPVRHAHPGTHRRV